MDLINIGDIATSVSETFKFKGENVVFLNTGDIYDGEIQNSKKVSPIGLPGQAKKSIKENDILFSEIRPINRRFAFVNFKVPDYVVSTKLMVIRTINLKILPKYLYYFLTSEPILRHLQVMAESRSGTFPQITFSEIKNIKMIVPDINIQESIVYCLDSINSLVENKKSENITLEGLAKAIFKSWFVDVDPVRAKMEGQELNRIHTDIASLFPDSFEASELGEIPNGWHIDNFGTTVELIGGGTPKTSVSEYWNGTIPWFSVVDVPNEGDIFVVDTERKVTEEGLINSSTRILSPGTTIITARGTVGKCALVGNSMTMNQSCYGVKGKGGRGNYFTYFALRNLVSRLLQSSHGTVFDTITRETFDTIKVICPPILLTQKFDETVSPFLDKILLNLHSSHKLITLRDALVPKLLLEDLRVKDAEKVVEASV